MNALEKYQKLSVEVRATFWFTICNFILKGISFITVPLFARYLSPTEYGTVSIYNSYQQIFLIFATFELSLGAFQRGLIRYKNDIKMFTKSLQVLWSGITLILFLGVFICRDTFVELTDTNVTILTLMFTYFLVQPAYDCWINLKRFKYDYKLVVVVTILFATLSTGISVLCVKFIDNTAIVRITSMLVVQILFCLPFYLRNVSIKSIITKRKIVKEYWVFALKFQMPLVVHSLSYLILAQSDRIMIGEMVGKTEAALYSIAYSLANVAIIFQTSINQVMKPWRYQKMNEKKYDSIGKITNILLLVLGGILLLFILVAPEIMKLLFSEEYFEAVWTIPPITLSVYFMFLYSIFSDIESYLYKTKYIMYASIVCATVNIVLNYFGIIKFGYIVCGYTTLISYILFAIMHYKFMKKSCIDEGIGEKIFDENKISILSVILIGLMVVFTIIYPYFWIRLILFFIIVIICVIKRDTILFALKELKL